jgi:hypothetical protein
MKSNRTSSIGGHISPTYINKVTLRIFENVIGQWKYLKPNGNDWA